MQKMFPFDDVIMNAYFSSAAMRCRRHVRGAIIFIIGLIILMGYAIFTWFQYVPWECDGCFQRPYNFTIMPTTVCPSLSPPDIIVVVMIAPKSHKTRKFLRETTLRFTQNNTALGIRHTFVVGVTKSLKIQQQLEMENQHHGDIIQQNFMDTYKNLTLKSLAAFEWVTKHCPTTKWIVKADEDLYINIVSLWKTANFYANSDVMLGACIYRAKPRRKQKQNKYYLSFEEYPYSVFPKYCCGPMYMLTISVAKHLLEVSPNCPFIRFEDVYMGLCLQKSPFPLIDIPDDGQYPAVAQGGMDCERWHKFLFIHSMPPDLLLSVLEECGWWKPRVVMIPTSSSLVAGRATSLTVASFTKEVNPRLAKSPLKPIGV